MITHRLRSLHILINDECLELVYEGLHREVEHRSAKRSLVLVRPQLVSTAPVARKTLRNRDNGTIFGGPENHVKNDDIWGDPP